MAAEDNAVDKALERLAEGKDKHDSLDAFFKHLDVDNNQSIDADELQKGLEQLGATLSHESICKLMESVGASGDGRLTFAQFEKIVRKVPSAGRETEEWVSSLGIQRLLATHLDDAFDSSQPVDDGMMGLARIASMKPEQVRTACAAFCADLEKVLINQIEQLQVLPGAVPEGGEEKHGKFQFASNGKVGDFASTIEFFGGLDGMIGLPNPNVFEAMEREHCMQVDSQDTFVTHNYGHHATTPAEEWEYVAAHQRGKEYSGKLRVHRDIEELMADPNAVKAGLILEEVVALRLYTGPMYVKYNAKLRNYPQSTLDGMKGNGYVTTIHCIVSGVIKLSKVWTLPKAKRVYRGLGGLMLPEAFWKSDEYGCRGGVERGLMSTTTVKEVAMQYSGTDSGRPTIFEISVGQIDRGANLNWLSQYPKEEEVLMPPLSNLEVIGAPRIESSQFGPVMVIPLRVNVNIKSSTIEEVLQRRKVLHLSMLENLVHSARHDLLDSVPAVLEREGAHVLEWSGVMEELEMLKEEAEQSSGEWYNDDNNLSNAMSAAMAAKKGAKRKFGALQLQLQQAAPFQRVPRSNGSDTVEHIANHPDEVSRGISSGFGSADVESNPGIRRASVSDERRRSSAVAVSRIAAAATGKEGKHLVRFQKTKVQDWAREGFQFMVQARTEVLPWDAIAEGKLSVIELPAQLNQLQAEIAWRCIKHGIEASPDKKKRVVQIRGFKGGVLQVDANEALEGTEITLWQERLDSAGKTVRMPQQPAGDAVCVLLPAIKNNPFLRRLDLGAPDLSSHQSFKVARILKQLPSLEVLRLSGDPIDVMKARSSPDLDFAIWKDAVGPEGDGHSNGGSKPTNGRQTSDAGSSTCGSVFSLLARALGRAQSSPVAPEPRQKRSGSAEQEVLSMRHTVDKRAEGHAMQKATSLIEVFGEELAADDVYTIQEGICLGGFLESNTRGLRVLNLAGHKIGAGGATALATALKGNTTLVELNLRGNMFGVMGAQQLAPVIKGLSRLEVLDLRGNNMGVRGPKALAPAVAPSPVLTTLNGLVLEYTTQKTHTKKDTSYLGSAGMLLANSGSIHVFKVRGMSEPGYEAAYIARRCREIGTSLEILDLSHNDMGLVGAKAIAHVMEALPNVKSLHMEGNSLRSEGLKAMLPAFESSRVLTYLDLRNNNIDDAGLRAMGQAMLRGLGRRWNLSGPGLKKVLFEGNIDWKSRMKGLALEAAARPGTSITFLTWDQYIKTIAATLGTLLMPVLLVGMFRIGPDVWDRGDEVGSFYVVFACATVLFAILLWHAQLEVYTSVAEMLVSLVLGMRARQLEKVGASDPHASDTTEEQKKHRQQPRIAIQVDAREEPDGIGRTSSSGSNGENMREMRREKRMMLAENRLFLEDDDDAMAAEALDNIDEVEEFLPGDEDDEEDEADTDDDGVDTQVEQEEAGHSAPELGNGEGSKRPGVESQGVSSSQLVSSDRAHRPHTVAFVEEAAVENGRQKQQADEGSVGPEAVKRDTDGGDAAQPESLREPSGLGVAGLDSPQKLSLDCRPAIIDLQSPLTDNQPDSATAFPLPGSAVSPSHRVAGDVSAGHSASEEDKATPKASNLTTRKQSTPRQLTFRGRQASTGVQSDGVNSQARFASLDKTKERGQEVAVDERVLRRVGMLTQQFKEATCCSESLDKRVKDVYKRMQTHSSGIATSQTQLADLLMLPAVMVAFLLLSIGYGVCAYYLIVPFAEGTIDLYSHFRLESVFANQTSAVGEVMQFGVFDGGCRTDKVNTTVLDGVIYLELEANIASKRVYLTFLPNASDHPVDISLSGCSLQSNSLVGPTATSPAAAPPPPPSNNAAPPPSTVRRAGDNSPGATASQQISSQSQAENTRWSCPDGWKKLSTKRGLDMQSVQEVIMVFQEGLQKTIVRFIPAVLCLTCQAVCYLNITMRRGMGRILLIVGMGVCTGFHVLAAVVSPTYQEAFARLMPAVMILPIIVLMVTMQSKFLTTITLYCLLYLPMVLWYLRHLLHNDYELPPIIIGDIRAHNYDQYNVAPMLFLFALASLVLRIRRLITLRWTIHVAYPDIVQLDYAWNNILSVTSSGEITDVSAEVDRMRAQISQPVRQLQPSTGQNARLVDAQEVALRHAEVRRTHLQDMWRAVGSTRQRQCESEQCITSMQQLFTQAAGLESLLREKLVAWACVSDGKFVRKTEEGVKEEDPYIRGLDVARIGERAVRWSGVKGKLRAVEKCYLAYGGDVSRLLDLCRETIVFEGLEQIANCLAVIRQDRTVEVVRVCNRLIPGASNFLAKMLIAPMTSWEKKDGPMISGYRDVSVNLMIQTAETRALGLDRHVVELRLVPRGIHELTLGEEGKKAHSRYQNLRNALTV